MKSSFAWKTLLLLVIAAGLLVLAAASPSVRGRSSSLLSSLSKDRKLSEGLEGDQADEVPNGDSTNDEEIGTDTKGGDTEDADEGTSEEDTEDGADDGDDRGDQNDGDGDGDEAVHDEDEGEDADGSDTPKTGENQEARENTDGENDNKNKDKEGDDGDTDKNKKAKAVLREESQYQVLEELPHDSNAFTQGLTFDGTNLYESTGLYQQSTVRLVDPETGEYIQKIKLDYKLFGEGMTYYTNKDGEGRLIQITWKAKRGFIYDSSNLEVVKKFTYETYSGEGWGITYNEEKQEFIVSDGSEYLMFWDRDSVEENDQPTETRRVAVMFASEVNGQLYSHPVTRINELEFYQGTVLANIWYRDVLLQIDETTGIVIKDYDFSKLYTNRVRHADCFNGISVTDVEDELWVTGKLWPKMYRIRLLADVEGQQ